MMKDVIFRKKPVRVLFEIFKAKEYATGFNISMDTRIAHSHICGILNKLSAAGLIAREKKRREVQLTLTTKGREIVIMLKKVDRMLGRLK